MIISILEEEYHIISLLTNLYHSFKITVKANKIEGRLIEELEKLDEVFIHNYASTYWFYHQAIRKEEISEVYYKLPYFPVVLLKYFRVNEFLENLKIKGDMKNILTFLNPSQEV